MGQFGAWAIRCAVAVFCACAAMFVPVSPAHADEKAFAFTDSRITECSGMATDTSRSYYWAINDTETSGGRIYAVKPNGDTVSSIAYGADLYDTEALAYYNGFFYVGDIGDNQATRETISVYVVSGSNPGGSKTTYTRYRFTYPDGAHDAEGMFISPSGRIFIVTKAATGAIYAAPTKLSTGSANKLTKVADAPAYATDATRLTDGRVAIRTYTSVTIYNGELKKVASTNTTVQKQGEAITQSLKGTSLLLASEGKYSSVLAASVPTSSSASTTPTTSATPTASATTAKASASASASTATAAPASGSGGTQTVLFVAGGVALLAGLIVFLRR